MNENEYKELKIFILDNFGFTIGSFLRVNDEVTKLIDKYHQQSFSTFFLACLQENNHKILADLISQLSNHYTFFNRENYQLKFLTNIGFSSLTKSRLTPLKFLSIGSSSGEEVYSLAIAYQEYQNNNYILDYEISSLDVSSYVIDVATKGVYSIESLKYLDGNLISKYFSYSDNTYTIKNSIRSKCKFVNVDFHVYKSTEKYDIILCRNVLLYYNPTTTQIFLEKMISLLNVGGYLMFGGAEMVNVEKYDLKYIMQSVYQKVHV
jgi:chemotaxis protein methyltransferase CheR